MSASAAIVAFAANAYAFRQPVRASARTIVADTLARALAGAGSPAVAAGASLDAPGDARMVAHAIGSEVATTPLRAALLSALAVGDFATIATPAVCAALALGEAIDAAGATVLDAIAAGIEVAVRLERALGAGHVARGWDVRGTCGRAGAAVAAGRVITLQRETMRDALGIAVTATGGLAGAAGTMTASYVPAAAAADGIEAVLLARAGFTGAAASIEGRRGIAALMTSTFDERAIVDGLGETFVFPDALIAPDASALPEALREAVAGMDRLASIRPLIAATLPSPAR